MREKSLAQGHLKGLTAPPAVTLCKVFLPLPPKSNCDSCSRNINYYVTSITNNPCSDLFLQRRRRASRPTTPGTGERSSPQTSPAKKGPKRAAPPPPRRPPLIPSFDEWRSGASAERGATGDNDRPAATSSAEGSPSRKISPATSDTTEKSDSSGSKSPGTAHKVSSSDGANQADIKLLARQVLMEARKKAGASGALPRERVAEIAKTSKGPTADNAATGSPQSEVGAQGKDKVMR